MKERVLGAICVGFVIFVFGGSIAACAALGWREVTVKIVGSEAGALDGGGE